MRLTEPWGLSPDVSEELRRVHAMSPEEQKKYFAARRPQCSRCVFYHETGGGSSPLSRLCRRYPEHMMVPASEWCGEFKENHRAEPKRIL